jgi:hypothetical protein
MGVIKGGQKQTQKNMQEFFAFYIQAKERAMGVDLWAGHLTVHTAHLSAF